MPDRDEQQLLHDYVASGSDAAFGGLVERHIDMVFGCALRRTGDVGMAEEVSQNVFTVLARKAHRLRAGAGLAGWLHRTALYESARAIRGESRRQRKMKAYTEHTSVQTVSGTPPDTVLPLLDEAIDELSDDDRRLVLLRFFEGLSFREVSRVVGKSEAASQRQVSRVLGKLEGLMRRRGVAAPAAALASILAAESAKAAPAGVAAAVSGGAVAGAQSVGAATLIANTIQTMTYAKTKTALLVAAVAAVPIGVQWNTIDTLKEELVVYEQDAESATEAGRPGVDDGGAGRRGGSALTGPGSAGGGTGKGAQGSSEVSSGAPYTEMLEDPVMRRLLGERMEAEIASSYGGLFDHFELGDAERAQLNKLLLGRQFSALAEAGAGGEGGFAYEEYETKIREALGEERYDEFERFERSIAERKELSAFRATLEELGQELPFETERELMAIMYEERQSHIFSTDPPSAEEIASGTISAEREEAYAEGYRALHRKIRGRVAHLLPADQLEVFAQNQAGFLRLMEAGMRMRAGGAGRGE